MNENRVIPEEQLFLFPFNYKDLCKPAISNDAENVILERRTAPLSPVQNENCRLEFESYYKNISRF